MDKYKKSLYNFEIEHQDGKILVFNTMKTTLAWIEEDNYNAIKHGDNIDGLDDEFIKNAYNMGYIVSADYDEIDEFKSRRKKYIYEDNPRRVGFVIAPTLRCNMHCKYCFQRDVENKKQMTKESADKVINYIISLLKSSSIKELWIRWFGGEPSLEFEIISYISRVIIKYCENNGIKYDSTMTSNGILIDEKISSKLNELKIRSIQVTLDGFELDYSQIRNIDERIFNQVIHNIKSVPSNVNVIININITRKIVEHIFDFIDYIIDEVIENRDNIKIAISMVYKYNNDMFDEYVSEEEYQKILSEFVDYVSENKLYRYFNCNLPRVRFAYCSSMKKYNGVIGPEAEIYRCDSCLGKKNLIIGDCINGLYNNDVEYNYLNGEIKEKCEKCNVLPICSGGCRDRQLNHEGMESCEAIKQKISSMVRLYLLNVQN